MSMEIDLLQKLFSTELESVDVPLFLIKILITALLSLLIAQFYIKYGNALSNRTALAKTFVLIAITTMLIISIVKSSLALSLGLVGALSIVRFRTAIKEPEELSFFFIVIAIGLGIGAGQFIATILGTLSLCAIIYSLNFRNNAMIVQNFTLRLSNPISRDIDAILDVLRSQSTQLTLIRLDESQNMTEMSFSIVLDDMNKLLLIKEDIQKLYPETSFSFLNLK